MGARLKTFIVLAAISLVWLLVLLKVGLWRATLSPADGVLSFSFDGWADYPAARHLFLAQFRPEYFEQGRAYVTYTYPFLFAMFLFLAPLHFWLGLPYNVAHNFIPYLYAAGLVFLLSRAARDGLGGILERGCPFRWLLAFVAVGLVLTDPLPWVSLLNYNRDNFHVPVAAIFCYLSTWVFYDEVPRRPLLLAGIFLALWSPIYVPAWVLASLFFNRALALERKWLLQVVAVCALAGFSLMLPVLVCRLAGVGASGSGFLYRSGLDGSTLYMTGILQAVFSPDDPRRWPAGFHFLIAAALGVGFHYLLKSRGRYRPLQQALFLLIPYATIAILLPQFTSIHPYFTDLLLSVPAAFLVAFWSLQRAFWENLNGRIYAAWLLVAGLILMTNLLTVAQNLRR